MLASLLLAATTTTRDLIVGLDRLRCPQILTQIATFMLRYLDVLLGEARRMRIARISRGDDPRFLWQVRGFAAGIGALFLRAFERGERVYLAMVSRGYAGRMPAAWREAGAATAGQWADRGDRCRSPAAGDRRRPRSVLTMTATVRTALARRTRRCTTPTPTGTSPCAAST